jgi:hypothetical protein
MRDMAAFEEEAVAWLSVFERTQRTEAVISSDVMTPLRHGSSAIKQLSDLLLPIRVSNTALWGGGARLVAAVDGYNFGTPDYAEAIKRHSTTGPLSVSTVLDALTERKYQLAILRHSEVDFVEPAARHGSHVMPQQMERAITIACTAINDSPATFGLATGMYLAPSQTNLVHRGPRNSYNRIAGRVNRDMTLGINPNPTEFDSRYAFTGNRITVRQWATLDQDMRVAIVNYSRDTNTAIEIDGLIPLRYVSLDRSSVYAPDPIEFAGTPVNTFPVIEAPLIPRRLTHEAREWYATTRVFPIAAVQSYANDIRGPAAAGPYNNYRSGVVPPNNGLNLDLLANTAVTSYVKVSFQASVNVYVSVT